eukprot:2974281-Prymnesium_polylepis.1
MDPMVCTYKLMGIQRNAEEKLSKLKDSILLELSAQVALNKATRSPPNKAVVPPKVSSRTRSSSVTLPLHSFLGPHLPSPPARAGAPLPQLPPPL